MATKNQIARTYTSVTIDWARQTPLARRDKTRLTAVKQKDALSRVVDQVGLLNRAWTGSSGDCPARPATSGRGGWLAVRRCYCLLNMSSTLLNVASVVWLVESVSVRLKLLLSIYDV